MTAQVLPFKQKPIRGLVSQYPRLECTTCHSDKFEIDIRLDVYCAGCKRVLCNIEVTKK